MKSRGLSLAAPILAAALAVPAEARANVESLELWTEFGARVVPTRRLRLTFTQNTRFSEYGLRRVIPEVEASYRVIGPLRLGVAYRYLWRLNGQGELQEGHRLQADATVQFEWRRFDFEIRSRFQWRDISKRGAGVVVDEYDNMWRNRLNVELNIRGPFTANAFFEHWTQLDGGPSHERFRVGAGLSAQASRWRFQLYYMRDMPDFIDSPNVNMLGVSARWNLDLTRP